MIELNVMLLVQLGNFLITLIFLNYLLIRPIRRIIRKREENISKLLAEAEDFSNKAEERLAKYEEALSQARAEAVKHRADLKADGLAEEARLLEFATGEAQKTLLQAKEEIVGEAKLAMAEFKLKVEDLARLATNRVLA